MIPRTLLLEKDNYVRSAESLLLATNFSLL